jgi:uncharacterized protein YdeI (YjbR/CyaY-like superfamily)
MPPTDARVDAYIENAAPFARPILRRLRAIVHEACPDVVETLKWGHPAFEHRGMLGGMAAFRAHAAFGLWKHEAILSDLTKAKEAMGSLGRLASLADLPPKATLLRYVREAVRLNEEGVTVPRRKAGPRRPARTPKELAEAIAAHPKAKATWEAFSPSHRREYAEWVAEAVRPETRAKRLATTIEWLAAGKPRNWKYQR